MYINVFKLSQRMCKIGKPGQGNYNIGSVQLLFIILKDSKVMTWTIFSIKNCH